MNDETSVKTVVEAWGDKVDRERVKGTTEAVIVFVGANPNQFAVKLLLPSNDGNVVGIGQCEKEDGSPRTTSDKLKTHAKKADPISLMFEWTKDFPRPTVNTFL